MIAWMTFILMVAVAAVGIAVPFVRGKRARRLRNPEGDVLARQLAEIDGGGAAAESQRVEVIRRFLSETPAEDGPARPLAGRALRGWAVGLAAIVAIGATLLYVAIGRPDLAASPPGGARQIAAGDAAAPDGRVAALVAQLEARMRQTPNDPQGWRLLGWSYMQTGRYADAANAYGRASALDPANADYPSAQGEALVRAAGGQVTPQAQDAFALALKRDPADPRARYFLAAAKDQAGDHAGAMDDWIALLKSAPPGAPWVAEVRAFVVRIAAARGQDIAARLPASPGADQMTAAQSMSPADQQAMIHTMVERLAARLKADPNDAEGWIQLMRARMVLRDPTAAQSAYRDARKAFAGAPDQLSSISQAARQLGVPGA